MSRKPARRRPQMAQNEAPPAGVTVQGWEEDPEPAVLVQRPAPDLSRQPLAFSFDQPAPPVQVYQPGTAEFRYWTAAEALRRGADFWAPLMPKAVWEGDRETLNVILDEGEDLNAYYNRNALNFFHGQGVSGTVYSGESPDIVCHEMGHGILDSIKPQLFDAMSGEVAAFHEAFADVSAILSALQLPSLRTAILSDTRGRLYTSSRLSRLAEQLGSAIRLIQPDAVEPDCLRNAVNSWVYRDPTTLPQGGPATALTSEAHNFSRVFSGAVYEIMAGMLAAKAVTPSAPTGEELQAVSVEVAKIIIVGVQQAPVVANWYAQVAAAMVNASTNISPAYPAILRAAFVRRSILSMDSAVNAAKLQQSLVVSAGAREVEQPLSEIALPADDYGLDDPILVTAASHARPFLVKSAATLQNGSVEPVSSSTAARSYLDDLFSRGRIDYGEMKRSPAHFDHGHRLCSHVLTRDKGAVRLRRRLFDCGFEV
jgi:hypothetical protein